MGALDAFGDAVERPMDLAEVNGHVFVNNVSLGLYAAIVQSPEYRDAKVDTTLSALPKLLGPGSRRWTCASTDRTARTTTAPTSCWCPTVPTARRSPPWPPDLGSTPAPSGSRRWCSPTTPPPNGSSRRWRRIGPTATRDSQTWSYGEFVVDSASAVAVGLDGEAMDMEPPLRFSIRPHALRVRLAHDAIGYSPAARASSARDFLPNLWSVALGRPVALDS